MRIEKRGTVIALIADDDKCLTDGVVYSTCVYLGAYDTPERWTEIDADGAEEATAEDYAEALGMIGVGV